MCESGESACAPCVTGLVWSAMGVATNLPIWYSLVDDEGSTTGQEGCARVRQCSGTSAAGLASRWAQVEHRSFW